MLAICRVLFASRSALKEVSATAARISTLVARSSSSLHRLRSARSSCKAVVRPCSVIASVEFSAATPSRFRKRPRPLVASPLSDTGRSLPRNSLLGETEATRALVFFRSRLALTRRCRLGRRRRNVVRVVCHDVEDTLESLRPAP